MAPTEPDIEQTNPPLPETAETETGPSGGVPHGLITSSRRFFTALCHGIPLELAHVVDPHIKKQILKEFRDRTKDSPAPKDQVPVMLELLARNFPALKQGTQAWMQARAHFFECVGLWGRFG